ncbi:28762_t:CDS:1, partial [Dentiscutata erythropus]
DECEENENVFFELIQNPFEILEFSRNLKVINDILEKQPDSPISALCVDVIQTQFLINYDLQKLSLYFMDATQILFTDEVKALQLISSISLLKSFGNAFWSTRGQENFLINPVEIDEDEELDINLRNINQRMELPNPLIHSFLIYLLKALKLSQGFSLDDIKRFCQTNKNSMPWLNGLEWTEKEGGRIDFNPYWYLEHYNRAEHAADRICRGDETFSNELLKSITNAKANEKDLVDLRVSFSGMIITRMYHIRASRELNQVETILAQKIYASLEKAHLP